MVFGGRGVAGGKKVVLFGAAVAAAERVRVRATLLNVIGATILIGVCVCV